MKQLKKEYYKKIKIFLFAFFCSSLFFTGAIAFMDFLKEADIRPYKYLITFLVCGISVGLFTILMSLAIDKTNRQQIYEE